MSLVLYLHWKPEEAAGRVKDLKRMGHDVTHGLTDGKDVSKALRESPPDVLVIDLTRLPSHGREVGVYVRSTKRLRHIPLLFVDGAAAKVERTREVLPDASYATWDKVEQAILDTIGQAPERPVVPPGAMEGYSGTPLVKKLGIKSSSKLMLLNAPDNFLEQLGLPPDVQVKTQARGKADQLLWFVDSRKEFDKKLPRVATLAPQLWICWPKKSSGVDTDLTQADVRTESLAAGLVDYKICSIDSTWSGLKFAKAKEK